MNKNKVYVVVSDGTGKAKTIFSNEEDAKSRCGSREHVEDFVVDDVINNELDGKLFYKVSILLRDPTVNSIERVSPERPRIYMYPESSPTKAYIYLWAASPEEALSAAMGLVKTPGE